MHPNSSTRQSPIGFGGTALPQTPAQKTFADWWSRLEYLGSQRIGNLETVLTAVAAGHVPYSNSTPMDVACTTLVQHEAYDVLVSVWNTHRTNCLQSALPFEPSLTLWLPHTWNPQDRDVMQKAFGQLQVQHLKVVSVAHDGVFQPIPEAMCQCVATWLANGTRELSVYGELAAPAWVVDALGQCAVKAIHFSPSVDSQAQVSGSELASFTTLARGLLNHGLFDRLYTQHGHLFEQMRAIEEQHMAERLRTNASLAPQPVNGASPDVVRDEALVIKSPVGSVLTLKVAKQDTMQVVFDSLREELDISDDKIVILLQSGKIVYKEPRKNDPDRLNYLKTTIGEFLIKNPAVQSNANMTMLIINPTAI